MYENYAFPILVLSTKKRYSTFLKKAFENVQNYANLSNGGLFWKFLVPLFRRTYAVSVGFKMKPLKKRFSVLRQTPTQSLR